MQNEWVVASMVAAVVLTLGLSLSFKRRRSTPVAFADEREEHLTGKLSKMLGCSLAQALPSMRQELQLAPNQPDDTLVKRAAYHYRQAVPDRQCGGWRDRTPG